MSFCLPQGDRKGDALALGEEQEASQATLTHHWLTDMFLYCCLTQEQQAQLKKDLDNKKNQTAYLLEHNPFREKEGIRCNGCRKFYPFLQIWYIHEFPETA